MKPNSPWKSGAALAVTMAISYILCAVAYALWPAQGVAFLNALFHGLDFGRLTTPAPFVLATALVPLLVLAVWGFVVGTVFAWIYARLQTP